MCGKRQIEFFFISRCRGRSLGEAWAEGQTPQLGYSHFLPRSRRPCLSEWVYAEVSCFHIIGYARTTPWISTPGKSRTIARIRQPRSMRHIEPPHSSAIPTTQNRQIEYEPTQVGKMKDQSPCCDSTTPPVQRSPSAPCPRQC